MTHQATEPVLIDKPRPHTTVITMNRPERMNSMAFELMIPLHEAFESVSSSPGSDPSATCWHHGSAGRRRRQVAGSTIKA